MGVLSLHNECPPLGFGEDAKAICEGLIIGEEGTSALLKSVADCVTSLASMDDTVGNVVGQWKSAMEGKLGPDSNGNAVAESYLQAFAALAPTIDRIDLAMDRYRKLKSYSHQARDAGRGKEFQAKLEELAGSDFDGLVNRRIELLRRLKVRILVLQRMEPVGTDQLKNNDFPGFFLVLMQPIRDVAVAVNELFAEVLRGALASHQALFQSCRLLGEGLTSEISAMAQLAPR